MTRRSSLRAQAQEFYREMVRDADDRDSLTEVPPTPDPSPPRASLAGGGEKSVLGERDQAAASGEGEATDLTARVRALYEGSAVPVRDIARLAGITERTVYKYVARHGWKKRYARKPRGEAAAEVNRGQGWQAAPGFAPDVAPVRGAGGRFIRREDNGQPFAAGLKATDPAGEARAAAACAEAERRARAAEAQAEEQRWCQENIRAIQAVITARDEVAAHDAARQGPRAWSRQAELHERALLLSLEAALDWMAITVAAWERAALSSRSPAP